MTYEPPKVDKDSSSSSSLEKSGSESPAMNKRDPDVPDSPPSPPPVNPPQTDLLVPLDQPVPGTWITKEDDYLTINPLLIPHLSSDFFGDPDVVMGSGAIRLTWVDGRTTRKGALSMMTAAESGRHVEMPEVFRIDVKAFRLEPAPSPPGVLTVDGERVKYGPIQAQVHPRLARIMSRKRKS